MGQFTDSLRGYGYAIHRRDGFRCRYCGIDGSGSFETWLTLSVDHLLPKGHPRREDAEFKVTACMFCNTADNRYFDRASERGVRFEGLTPDQLVAQRRKYVNSTRDEYRAFWASQVFPRDARRN
jgi:hypothetical protein